MTAAVAATCMAALTGCRGERSDKPPRELLPDMDNQPRWNPQSKSEFFADHRTMRKPPAHAVPFGRADINPEDFKGQAWVEHVRFDRAGLLAENAGIYHGLVEGVDPDTAWVLPTGDDPAAVNAEMAARFIERIPIEVTPELLARGQERFNIYCAVCHGYQGEGASSRPVNPADPEGLKEFYGGMVGRRWSYAVPSYHGDAADPTKYTDPSRHTGRDGYLFYVAMNGVRSAPTAPGAEPEQKMPGYAHALNVNDAWAIVAYVRALQHARNMNIADVPLDQQAILRTQRPGGDQ